jgi:predicted DNA-binding transcriptional regulator AlpA
MRIQKVCQFCDKPFIAQKTTTKFCSLACGQKNYKKQLRDEKITNAILDTNAVVKEKFHVEKRTRQVSPKGNRLNQDFIAIGDLAIILGVSERTLFRAIKDPAFPKVRIGRRLVFEKVRVVEFLNEKYRGGGI